MGQREERASERARKRRKGEGGTRTARMTVHPQNCRAEFACRGGLVFKAQRFLHQSTLGSKVTKKKKKIGLPGGPRDA